MVQDVKMRKGVPLVRIEGKAYDTGEMVTPERLAAEPRLLRKFKTKRTIRAEDVLELGDCLYFYVGYACPGFGDMVFVFDPAVSARWSGTATPFDTGGVIGYIRALGLPGKALDEQKRRDATPLTPEETRLCREYVHAHRIPEMGRWQRAFAEFLAAYYKQPGEYVRGTKPDYDDKTGRHHHDENIRPAWTWEIQAHCDHDLFDGLWLLRLSFEKEQKLWAALEEDDDETNPWWRVLEDADVFSTSKATEKEEVSTEAQKVIESWVV